MMTDAIEIFICSAREDEIYLDKLKAHLGALRRQNYITIWDDRSIQAGSKWQDEIDNYLETVDIIVLLISADFMKPDQYYTIEMKHAFERHERKGTYVVPVLLRPCSWENTVLAQFEVLPKNHVPVIEFPDEEEAFCDIAKELRYFVENLNINKWREKGNEFYKQGKYKDAFLFYEKILRQKNNLAASIDLGNVLNDLQDYEEALHVYNTYLREAQIDTFLEMKNNIDESKYKEALQIYEQIFQQSVPKKSDVLGSSRRGMAQEDIPDISSQSSLEPLNEAIRHSPTNPFLYHLKGNVLFILEQYREALGAYEQAIQLQEGFELAHQYLSATLEKIGQQEYRKLDICARRDLQKAHQLRDEHSKRHKE